MLPLPAVALAASVVLPPLHIAVGVAVGAIVGFAFTATVTVPVTVQELLLVTVTVYVVFVVGETVPPATFPASPLLQAYVEMLPLPATALAARVVLVPLQIVDGAAVGATVGFAFTVTVTVPVAVQVLLLVTVIV